MLKITKTMLPLALIISSSALFSATQSQDSSPGEELARMQALGEKYGATNENHELLKRLEGDWITVMTIMGMEQEPGTTSNRMILGGRYLEADYAGNVAGMPYEGKMTVGFDNYKQKFMVTFIDSLGTAMNRAEGLLDQSGNTITLWGTMDEWMTGEHDKPVMYKLTYIDDDHYVYEVHDLGIVPGNTLVVHVSNERVK